MTKDIKNRTPHQKRIDQMMALFGQDVPLFPIIPDVKVRESRAKMMLSETLEKIKGLGFSVVVATDETLYDVTDNSVEFQDSYRPDLIEIVDGCVDCSVIATGTLSACGVADEALLEEVDRNNLEKFGPGGYLNRDMKWIKPAGHKPPRIREILELQGWKG